jgi:integrase
VPRPAKNKLLFTDRSLGALKPTLGRVDYMDTGLQGLGIIVRPNGKKTFFVRYRLGRRFRRVILGDYPAVRLRGLRDRARQLLGRVADGDDPQAEKVEQRGAVTFRALAASYLAVHAKRRKRTWRQDERMLERDLLPSWGHLVANEIRRRDVVLLLDRVVARGSPVMANRIRALVSKIFAFALARDLVEFNPVAGSSRPGEERSRARVLTEAEIAALWNAWEADGSVTSAVFRMLLLTAQREGEVLAMRWKDLDGQWWTIPSGIVKNKLEHRVYLSDEARSVLNWVRGLRPESEWVFASPKTTGHVVALGKAKERFRAETGIADWRPHDLRRTAATYMGRLGISRPAIARVLNHAERGVTAIYDRSTGERDIESALRVWGERLAAILRGEPEAQDVLGFKTSADVALSTS